jgi:nucleoside-diphosphate kinase
MQIPKWLLIIVLLLAAGALFFLLRKMYIVAGLGKKIERTLAIIKPDAVVAKNSGKIIDRIEQEGFNILAMKKMLISQEQAEKFYEIHKDRIFFKELVEFMTSSPSIVMVLEKENAIKSWRDLMGSTDPKQAAEGTIRQLYGTTISKNAVHGSDGLETAKNEVLFFFPDVK